MNEQTSNNFEFRVFGWIWAIANLCLIALTWKLWFPGFTEFPRVPVFSQIAFLTTALSFVAAIGLVVGLGMVALCRRKQAAMGVVAVSFFVAFICNQHCLQPWAWQAFIIAVLLASLPVANAKIWIGRLLISIYLFSAIGKFDYQFAYSLGISFVDVFLEWLQIVDSPLGMSKPVMALLFPAFEILVAVGLMFRATRKLSAIAAIALHVSLIAILSPLGLGHRLPVILWNLLSIILVCWVFFNSDSSGDHSSRPNTVSAQLGWTSNAAALFAMIVIAGPLLRPMQLWDHWLAWGLYSPSNSRAEVFIADVAISDGLDSELGDYFAESEEYPATSQFDLAAWSLEELGVPIYPEARFQSAAAAKWLQLKELEDFSRIVELGPSDPLTGQRSKRQIR